MRKTVRRITLLLAVTALIAILAGFSCDHAKSAAVANNRYLESLSHFQDAAKLAHDQRQIDDATYRKILDAEEIANKTGRELNAGIAVAARGGDYTQYIAQAQASFNAFLDVVKLTNKQDLITLAAATGALLQNTISLIQQIKAATGPGGMALWLMLPLLGMALTEETTKVLQLIQLVMSLEAPALDLVLKLATSLKGKTVEEVLAMNDALADKIDTEIADERKKLDNPPPQ